MQSIFLAVLFSSIFYNIHGLGFPFTLNFNQANPWSGHPRQFPLQFDMSDLAIPELSEAEAMADESENLIGKEDNNFLSDIGDMPEMLLHNMKNRKNVSSKNTTTEKDGYTVKMYNQSGPGFVSFVEEVIPNNRTNGTKGAFKSAKMMGGQSFGARMFPGWKMLAVPQSGSYIKKCRRKKNCRDNQFCDPYSRTCQQQVREGGLCSGKNQCKQGLICVWGKCQKTENYPQGSLGTFCQSDANCTGDSFCKDDKAHIHAICSPRVPEGLECEEMGLMNLLENMGQKPKVSVCKDGLLCTAVPYNDRFKICVKENYVTRVQAPNEGSADSDDNSNNESTSDDNSDGESEDEKSDDDNSDSEDSNEDKKGDDGELDEDQSIPIETGPSKGKGGKKTGRKSHKSHKSHGKKHKKN